MDIHLLSLDEAVKRVASTTHGLSANEATRRLSERHATARKPKPAAWDLLINQFRSPLVLLLLAAMAISLSVGDRMDVLMLLAVVLMSTMLGFWQEYRASNAVAALLNLIQTTATVVRDGNKVEIPVHDVVAGDVVILNAGDTIPGDGLLMESKDLFVDESALTGESFPSEKKIGAVAAGAGPSEKTNTVFKGTHVVSGTARALMMAIGTNTQLGGISERLRLRAPETEFERGLRRFGGLLIHVTLVLVIMIFAINVYFHRPVLESFMFAIALAVGMTPELLPAIVSINLARGAKHMADEQVIVRKLSVIENFGSMTVLCSDKTGTLTEGRVTLHAAIDADGHESPTVRLHAVLNATFESGFTNPIDEALRSDAQTTTDGYTKFDEVPYDFIRKRLSVVVAHHSDTRHLMITKGAFANVIASCTKVATTHGDVPMTSMREALQQKFHEYSIKGQRVLGIATRDVTGDPVIDKDDERDMTFEGFLLFEDPPKPDVMSAINDLQNLGVSLKIITGDNQLVARCLSQNLGMKNPKLLTGAELRELSDAALVQQVGAIDVFAETEPNQKERILIALKKSGEVVGFLGDGINDAMALHAADVGISVDGAVDVAKEAADIILMRHDLGILARGVRNGRSTFVNTLKYMHITTSANFGNMFSMAGASFFLPFLPLLPKQILLNNFLSDLPALAIATDRVDAEQVSTPRRLDHHHIRRFMIAFGLVSSAFDFLTFGALLVLFNATEAQFQTGWFIESLMTELFIVMVIRTHRPFFQSKPGRILTLATLLTAATTITMPYTALGKFFGLVPLPWNIMATLIGITTLYLLASEGVKQLMFERLARATSTIQKTKHEKSARRSVTAADENHLPL